VFIYIAELNRKIFFGSFFVTVLFVLCDKNNFNYKSYTKIIPNRFSQFHIFFISPGTKGKMIAVYEQMTVVIYLISGITYVIYNVNKHRRENMSAKTKIYISKSTAVSFKQIASMFETIKKDVNGKVYFTVEDTNKLSPYAMELMCLINEKIGLKVLIKTNPIYPNPVDELEECKKENELNYYGKNLNLN